MEYLSMFNKNKKYYLMIASILLLVLLYYFLFAANNVRPLKNPNSLSKKCLLEYYDGRIATSTTADSEQACELVCGTVANDKRINNNNALLLCNFGGKNIDFSNGNYNNLRYPYKGFDTKNGSTFKLRAIESISSKDRLVKVRLNAVFVNEKGQIVARFEISTLPSDKHRIYELPEGSITKPIVYDKQNPKELSLKVKKLDLQNNVAEFEVLTNDIRSK